jgi:hypothetical protein
MPVHLTVTCFVICRWVKIIRTVGTCFVVGYSADWAWQDTHGLLLSYHCGAGVTLIDHFCHEFCAIDMDTAFNLHQKRAEGSDPFLWAEGAPGAEMHRRMSMQYGNSVMLQWIVCKWIERFKNGRTNVKHGEGTAHQSTSITDADMEQYGMILQNTVETLEKLNFEVLEHPLYSLDLTPSDSPVSSS